MGDDATVMRKIKIGQLQGGAFTGGEATVITPDAQIYSMPFLFRDQEEIDKVRAKLDPLVKQQFENAGFELLGISGGGFAYLMSIARHQDRATISSPPRSGCRRATRSPRSRSRSPASRRFRCRCRMSIRACRPD